MAISFFLGVNVKIHTKVFKSFTQLLQMQLIKQEQHNKNNRKITKETEERRRIDEAGNRCLDLAEGINGR